MMPPLLPPQQKWRAGAAVVLLLLLAALAVLPPLQKGFFDFPGCLFYKMTGLPCPLCGGTRATSALLHGDLNRTLDLNPLAFVAVAALLGIAGICGWEAVRGRALLNWPARFKQAGRWFPLVLFLLIVWWLLHVWSALRGPKSELLDLRNPIARSLHEDFRAPAR